MWPLKIAWYRTFQAVFDIGARFMPWRKAITVEGAGSINEIPGLLTTLRVNRPLIVTDPGLMKAGISPRVLKVLDKAAFPYTLYDSVEANPSVHTVNTILQLYVEEHCDGFIAIGGGSAIDAAKAAAARAVNPKKSVNQLGGLLKVHRKLPPFIAVPTTAGTGSETTIAALITDTETHHKYAIMDLHLIPLYAVLDADLIVGLPPFITATTGMDTLTHAVEAYLCWTYNTKESIRFAEDAVKLIFRYLERAWKDGHDIEAREGMQTASYKAGFAFTRAGVGNVHAIAHTLGGLYNAAHGLANAVILPVVLEDYGKKVFPKLARLAELAGVAAAGDDADKAMAFIQSIRDMNARMGIPAGFDFIKNEDIGQIVKWAGAETNPLYPVPVLYSPERFRCVLQKLRVGDTVQKA